MRPSRHPRRVRVPGEQVVRKALAKLGARFDVRAFHPRVLGSGCVPLELLEAKVDGWLAA